MYLLKWFMEDSYSYTIKNILNEFIELNNFTNNVCTFRVNPKSEFSVIWGGRGLRGRSPLEGGNPISLVGVEKFSVKM